jgi:hypothetical protein
MKYVALLTLLMATGASAHHGWSEYDSTQPLQLTGTIQDSGYEHPHGYLRLSTDDKQWTVILAPPSRMENRGLGKEMLAVGNQVTVAGYPHRSNTEELRAERITAGGKTTELR